MKHIFFMLALQACGPAGHQPDSQAQPAKGTQDDNKQPDKVVITGGSHTGTIYLKVRPAVQP